MTVTAALLGPADNQFRELAWLGRRTQNRVSLHLGLQQLANLSAGTGCQICLLVALDRPGHATGRFCAIAPAECCDQMADITQVGLIEYVGKGQKHVAPTCE